MIATGSAARLPLRDDSVACAVFSPPYNCGIAYRGYDDLRPWWEYVNLVQDTVAELYRVVMPGGRVWVNVQHVVPWGSDGKRIDISYLWAHELRQHFSYRDTIAWIQDAHDGGTAWGSWLSPAAPNLRGGWETILLYYKGTWNREAPHDPFGRNSDPMPRHDLGGDWTDLCRNVWTLPPERDRARSPAAFPIELPARCIRLSTWPGEIVLDPFGGSGTTAAAAQVLGRECVSIDLSPQQSQIAADRLNTIF